MRVRVRLLKTPSPAEDNSVYAKQLTEFYNTICGHFSFNFTFIIYFIALSLFLGHLYYELLYLKWLVVSFILK